jgi:hypothetical protein
MSVVDVKGSRQYLPLLLSGISWQVMGFFRKDSWCIYGIRTQYLFGNVILFE